MFPHAAFADDNLLDKLTLEQRVAQLFVVNLFGGGLTEVGRDFLARYQPGGVVLLGDNLGTPETVSRLINSYQQTVADAGGLPLFVSVDQEMGPISHLKDGFTVFPSPALLTASGDPELAHQVGQAVGEELLAVGVNMDLAPVADLETNPKNTIIVRRSFGSDPQMVSTVLGPFVQGMQSSGVLAIAKHFPGHGASTEDSHTSLPVIDLSKERLESVELAPFHAAVEAEVAGVMVAHISYPALESTPNLPASLSSKIVDGLLRGEMGYNGLVMTDALDMDAIDTTYSYPQAVLTAIKAGVDLVIAAHMSLTAQIEAIEGVVAAVQSGEILEERLNESVQRVLDAKARFNLLNWQPPDPATLTTRLNQDVHNALIDTLFRAGVTVAFDHNQLLPLQASRNIAIVYPATRSQIAQECGTYNPNIRWVGVSDSPQETEIGWALDAARWSDAVVVFTQNADTSKAQQALVNQLPPEKTVVVALWSPYVWADFPAVDSYVLTYSPARPAVPAACAVLFGAVPAQGKLSITLSESMPAGISAASP